MPEIVEVPFTLTPARLPSPRSVQTSFVSQEAKFARPLRRQAAGPTMGARLPLLARLDVEIAGGVIGLPREGHEALLSWLTMQEIAHGQTPQTSRVKQLIESGDWERARQAAIAATCVLVTRASCRAKTEEERDVLLALLKPRPTA